MPKSKGARAGWLATNIIIENCRIVCYIHHFVAGPSFHFGRQKKNNVDRDTPLHL